MNIENFDINKSIKEIDHFLEYIIVTISKTFQLKPIQTLSLLADN